MASKVRSNIFFAASFCYWWEEKRTGLLLRPVGFALFTGESKEKEDAKVRSDYAWKKEKEEENAKKRDYTRRKSQFSSRRR